MDERAIVSTFELESDTRLNEHVTKLAKITDGLCKFGLTQNQARTYIFLGKYGPQTAPVIFKSLNLPRTETYHLLNGLQKMGVVTAIFGHPIRFIALSFSTVVKTLVNSQRENLNILEKEGNELQEVWDQIPDLSDATLQTNEEEGKFQMLKGQTQILNKIIELCNNTKKEFLVLGSEKDYMTFYHSNFLDSVKNSKVKVKLLTSCSANTMYIFKELGLTRVRRIPEEATENLCFIVKDDEEVVFFIKNGAKESQDLLAVWADATSIISSLKLLFNLLWSKTKISAVLEKPSLARESRMNYDFKLRELEQERLLIAEIKKYFSKMDLKRHSKK